MKKAIDRASQIGKRGARSVQAGMDTVKDVVEKIPNAARETASEIGKRSGHAV